jgi:hypothetical protein
MQIYIYILLLFLKKEENDIDKDTYPRCKCLWDRKMQESFTEYYFPGPSHTFW